VGRRVALVLVVGAAMLLGTAVLALASFGVSTSASQSISSASLGAPSGLTAVPSGHNVVLNWAAGTGGTGYEVDGVANGTSSNCSAVTFASLAAPATTTYTDAGRYTPQGTYECYRVLTARGNWRSVSSNPTAAAQLGVVASTVAVISGGSSGNISNGDQLVITFNQAITPSTGPATGDTLCTAKASNTIVVGSTSTGSTCSTTAATISGGTLTGGTASQNSRSNATFAWNAADTVLTVTVGSLSSGSAPAVTGTQTFTSATTATALTSATGAFHACSTNTGGNNCTPAATGSF
jgi:hypothetical protein